MINYEVNIIIIDGIHYSYKRGDDITDITKGFTFEEGIIALACSNGDISHAI